MNYLLLFVVVCCASVQNILRKVYNTRTDKPTTYFFSLVSALFALLFFVISAKFRFEFNTEIIPYSVGFAVSYALALAGSVLAILNGPLSLTMLITSYSLIIPTFFGMVVYGDTLGIVGITGLLLLGISLFLINKKGDNSGMSFKWFICVLVTFLGNGFCSVFQKVQQNNFDGAYKNEFMIVSLVMVCIFMIVAMIITKEKADINNSLLPAAGCGIANGIVNLLVMVLTGVLPSIILYPSIAAGGIVIGYIVSVFVYKEKLTVMQNIGYILGTASVILLNL